MILILFLCFLKQTLNNYVIYVYLTKVLGNYKNYFILIFKINTYSISNKHFTKTFKKYFEFLK